MHVKLDSKLNHHCEIVKTGKSRMGPRESDVSGRRALEQSRALLPSGPGEVRALERFAPFSGRVAFRTALERSQTAFQPQVCLHEGKR